MVSLKLGPHDVWYMFVMCDPSWFVHRVYEEICVIWANVSFVHSSHLVRQSGGKLTHIKTNGSRMSMIRYLVQTIIYRNTSMDLSVIRYGVDASKQHIRRIANFFGQQAHSHIMCMCQMRRIFLNTFKHHAL